MRSVLFSLCHFVGIVAFSQSNVSRPILDTSVLGKFPSIEKPIISNDGKFVSYVIKNRPSNNQTLVVQATEGEWKKEFVGAVPVFFSGNSKLLIFKSRDSLCFLELYGNSIKYIPRVGSYKQPGRVGSYNEGEWIAYQLVTDTKLLILKNLLTGKEKQFESVTEYAFEENGKSMLLKTTNVSKSILSNQFLWVSLPDGTVSTIWNSADYPDKERKVGAFKFDREGRQLVYLVQEKSETLGIAVENSIWYYKLGMDKGMKKIRNGVESINSGYNIASEAPLFSENGEFIFFGTKPNTNSISPQAVKVNVWSYRDSVLQSQQLLDIKSGSRFTLYFSMPVNGDKLLQLTKPGESAMMYKQWNNYVVTNNQSFISEYWWHSFNPVRSLVSLRDGSKRVMPWYFSPAEYYSPSGRHIVYYDLNKQQYFNYEIETGNNICISKEVPVSLGDQNYTKGLPGNPVRPPGTGLACWFFDETAVLIYDNYDIWELDAKGEKPPVNITGGYGLKNHTSFKMINDKYWVKGVSPGDTLLLSAVDNQNKKMGFYKLTLNKQASLNLLTMTDNTWGFNNEVFPRNIEVQKARDSETWIIARQSASEAPNLYATKDFKNFKALTSLAPQKKYNWLTTELITWKLADGSPCQGILYKPGDFDIHNKYPVLFSYYEISSEKLNVFLKPEFSGSRINIPWFVSHGYLVFVPDIHNPVVGHPGKDALNSILSAAQYLSRLPYVDAKHMGLQGHSWGGYETNYIITHTRIFAAAAEAAGMSNFISDYGGLQGAPGSEGESNQTVDYEGSQCRMGGSLWSRPKTYIDNSPIFRADKMTTPLLIMHNRKDPSVSWSQGVEWFTGLRRLQKKAWMLEYDEGTHSADGKDAVDYTIRMTQFFDHYLKEKPAPVWMTKGIGAKDKGIITGYDLDLDGWCVKDCIVCKKLHQGNGNAQSQKIITKQIIELSN